jgi:hypothetical protein
MTQNTRLRESPPATVAFAASYLPGAKGGVGRSNDRHIAEEAANDAGAWP